MLVKENVQNISKVIDKLFNFVTTDQNIQKDLQIYLESLPEKIHNQNQLQTALMPYVFDNTLKNFDKKFIDYYIEHNSDITNEDMEVLQGLKKTIFSIFKINKVLKNGFELYNLVNEKTYNALTLVKMTHFRDVFANQYMISRIFPMNDEFYMIEVDNIMPERASLDAIKYAVMMQLENPSLIYADNEEKLDEIKNNIEEMTGKFNEFFGGDEIITTTEYVDDLLGYFNDFVDNGDSAEKINIEDFIKVPDKFAYFDVKEVTTGSSDIMEAAVMGFASHDRVYDVGVVFDPEFGMTVLPFYGTFKQIFAVDDYTTLEGYKECILNYFNSQKIPPIAIIRVYKNNPDSFKKVVSGVLELKESFSIEKLMDTYKKDYMNTNKFSSPTVLYSSRAFSDLMDSQEIEMKKADNSFSSVGRNAPCPCGSGKKYKKCCLAD